MPYIGNQPFGKTVRTVTTETITSVKTAYYPNGGYMAGYVDVYVNGVRLSESLDFTATDGSLVTLLYSPSIGDTVEIVTYGSVEIANAVRRSGDTFSGNVYVGSNVYISTSTISVGNATVNTQITAGNLALNGSTLTIGNSTVNTVFTGDTVTVGGTLSLGNTSITGTANVTTAINVGANVSMNTTSIRVGNSTVNTYIVSDTIYGPSTLYIDPAAAGDNTGLVIVKGDLQVDGTTFTINSANVTVNDKNVVLASGAINNAATDGAGLTIYGTNANLTYNATGNNFEMSRGLSITGTANVSVGLNVGANVNLSTSQINVGNSTVNTVISSSALTTTSNTATFGTAVYIAANGNVGIGTNSTYNNAAFASLAIGGSSSSKTGLIALVTSAGADSAHIDVYNSQLRISTNGTANPIGFYTGGGVSQNMTLDSSGNLGIGTTSPTNKLTVDGQSDANNSSKTGANILVGTEYGLRQRGASAGISGIGYAAQIYSTTSGGPLEVYSSGNTNPLVFGTNSTERARIDASGNLGVGTTSPINKLDVRAASAVIGNYQTIQALSTDSAAINLGGGIGLGGFYSGTAAIAVFGSIVGRKENSTDGNYAGYLAFGTNAQATGVVEQMRLDSTGNLTLSTGSLRSFASPAFSLGGNQFTDIMYISAGGYGAIMSGILTVYSTYSGAVTQNSYFVNVIGHGGGTGISMISQGNYSTPATIIVYDRGSVLGGGSRVISVYNATGTNIAMSYSFSPVGASNSAAYYSSLFNSGSAGAGTGIPSGDAVYFGQNYAQVKAANIIFPASQSASSDVNTLDDYEEGTWTPAISGFVLSVARSSYTKIGRLVTVSATITISSGSGSGSMAITNLPFPGQNSEFTGSVMLNNIVYSGDPVMYCYPPNQFFEIYLSSNNAAWTTLQSTSLGPSDAIIFSITYISP